MGKTEGAQLENYDYDAIIIIIIRITIVMSITIITFNLESKCLIGKDGVSTVGCARVRHEREGGEDGLESYNDDDYDDNDDDTDQQQR